MFWGLIPTFAEVEEENLVEGFFLAPFILNRIKISLWSEIDNVTSYFLISSKNLKAVYFSFIDLMMLKLVDLNW